MAAAAGGGAVVEEERIKAYMAFRKDWIHGRLGMKPADLFAVHVTGDSMEPTLKAGDVILINRARSLPVDGCLYLIRIDDSLVVKRIQLQPGGQIQALSDNPAYAPFRLDPADKSTAILGQVIWYGRSPFW